VTPCARLSIAEAIAARRSAVARSSAADIATSRPSEDTAMAAVTPAVSCTKRATNQLKFWTSSLMSDAGVVI
jgi:hypothetical protein